MLLLEDQRWHETYSIRRRIGTYNAWAPEAADGSKKASLPQSGHCDLALPQRTPHSEVKGTWP